MLALFALTILVAQTDTVKATREDRVRRLDEFSCGRFDSKDDCLLVPYCGWCERDIHSFCLMDGHFCKKTYGMYIRPIPWTYNLNGWEHGALIQNIISYLAVGSQIAMMIGFYLHLCWGRTCSSREATTLIQIMMMLAHILFW